MSEKIIRDPVHDVILFRIDQPIDALLFRLLNAAEFQRLRRIRQLGLTNLAYPGADHSRYSHSLGVMETARKILRRLRQSVTIDSNAETICLVAALLHDLGHGPFSHVFERVAGFQHELMTQRVIQDPQSEIHSILASHDPQLPQALLDFLNHRPKRTFLNDIIASQLDADRFDYLLRDNLMTGARYGEFDLAWLLQAITIDPATDRLAINYKGISAVEAYLQARYHMYRNVYFHKVVRSAEGMVKLALHRARLLAVQDRLPWPQRHHHVAKALLGQSLTNDEFVDLDDVSMLQCFKLWTAGDDLILARLCRGLLFRRLHKVIDLSWVRDDSRIAQAVALAEKTVEESGGDPAYDLFLDEPSNEPYVPFKDGILIRDPLGQTTDFSRTSPLISAMQQQLHFLRLHIAAPYKGEVQSRLKSLLSL